MSETAWLIERNINGPPEWLMVRNGGLVWTTDPNEALRLSRRIDAEMLLGRYTCKTLIDKAHCTEHIWDDCKEEEAKP